MIKTNFPVRGRKRKGSKDFLKYLLFPIKTNFPVRGRKL